MSHVKETLEKCLELVKAMEQKLNSDPDPHSTTSGQRLLYEIKSALEIVNHEAVQLPKDKREAALMKQVAQIYLGEITL